MYLLDLYDGRDFEMLNKLLVLFLTLGYMSSGFSSVRLKDIARIEGVQENHLVGYGLVVGLSGSGDVSMSKATVQSLRNVLQNFSLNLKSSDISSRNVASVMITSVLPAFAQVGDKIDVTVSSVGDAKSLLGGTLLMTPLKGANNKIYALAQGSLIVGGYNHEVNGNRIQKNHPTVGVVPNGAKVEESLTYEFLGTGDSVNLLLKKADFTTASRIMTVLKSRYPKSVVVTNHPGKVSVSLSEDVSFMKFMADLESLRINPDSFSRVVVNERTGTVVAGTEVSIDNVIISHGDLKLKIETNYSVSQPSGTIIGGGPGVESVIVANSDLDVQENSFKSVSVSGASIGDLVDALKALKLSSRDLISVLQAIDKAGALHAELVIQ